MFSISNKHEEFLRIIFVANAENFHRGASHRS